MILVYEFEYISNNNFLENFLKNFAEKNKIEHYITKNKEKISLHVKGSEDALLAFSDELSNSLPFSIFLKSTHVNAVDEWDSGKAVDIKKCEVYLPFTKEALNRAKKDFNPFVKNETGLNFDINPPLFFTYNDKSVQYENSFQEAFLQAADVIESGEKLNLKTLNGTFCISKVKDTTYSDDTIIMPCDLSLVGKIAVMEDEEAAILASLEKPVVKAHVNLVFSSQYLNFPKFIKLRLASDLFLYFLSLALLEKGVKFVALEAEDDAAAASLGFGQEIKNSKWLEVCHLKSGQNIIIKGTVFTPPKLLNSIKPLKNPHHMQFAATIHELELFEEINCGIYLSRNHNDMIMLYSDKTGVLDILQTDFEDSLDEMLERIKKEDENGGKLLDKYNQSFSKIYENAKNIRFEVKNISTLWAAAAYLLGFGEDSQTAKKRLFENIELFGGQKGVRVDYKLTDEKSLKTSLNAHKFLKSVISFKLAGADDGLLSFGIAESLIHFLNDFADKVKDEFEVKNILLMGSLFGSKTVSNLCVNHISVNHKVYFNKELPIEL
ncbi:MAG: hypothetical protein LBS26_01815 [Campylobacteraceae bacterium]|jgi:hypothetical protein|nr:hypothetical protein [Campylobacteraceae bacterium]